MRKSIALNREINELMMFTDRELNDIGLTRGDINVIAKGYNLTRG